LWQWYEYPPDHDEVTGGRSFTWSELLGEWAAIVADFEAVYHRDLGELFEVKSWKWFETRVVRLLQVPESFLYKALVPRR
jgi:hypothetical protein